MSAKILTFRKARGAVRTLGDAGEVVIRFVKRNDVLPDNLVEGELERLKGLKAVAERAVVRVIPAGETQPQDPDKQPAPATGSEVSLETLANASVSQITNWIADGAKNRTGVGVKKLLEAVGADKVLAQRVIDAEKTALKGDARSSLVKGLQKVVDAETPAA